MPLSRNSFQVVDLPSRFQAGCSNRQPSSGQACRGACTMSAAHAGDSVPRVSMCIGSTHPAPTRRSAWDAQFTKRLVLPLITLPPAIGTPTQASQKMKWLTLGKIDMSATTSESTNAVIIDAVHATPPHILKSCVREMELRVLAFGRRGQIRKRLLTGHRGRFRGSVPITDHLSTLEVGNRASSARSGRPTDWESGVRPPSLRLAAGYRLGYGAGATQRAGTRCTDGARKR